jgi:hypothetical protein
VLKEEGSDGGGGTEASNPDEEENPEVDIGPWETDTEEVVGTEERSPAGASG